MISSEKKIKSNFTIKYKEEYFNLSYSDIKEKIEKIIKKGIYDLSFNISSDEIFSLKYKTFNPIINKEHILFTTQTYKVEPSSTSRTTYYHSFKFNHILFKSFIIEKACFKRNLLFEKIKKNYELEIFLNSSYITISKDLITKSACNNDNKCLNWSIDENYFLSYTSYCTKKWFRTNKTMKL